MSASDELIRAPSPDQCWSGDWRQPDRDLGMWTLAGSGRTVSVLPSLHPWRLADDRGSGRVMLWVGQPDQQEGVAVLTRTGRDPVLPVGDDDPLTYTPMWGLGDLANASLTVGIADACWLGALARCPGAWLPDLAVLPRATRGIDDPGTSWPTESVDFAAKFSVYADDTRYAADVLAPNVMALILDRMPKVGALTIAGDALHVWLPYNDEVRNAPGLAQQMVHLVADIREAIPSFVLADHPDRSDIVESDLAAKQEAAKEYQDHRQLGHSDDPTLQRIYDQARAQWEAGDVSSHP
jgi:hypothetical protein